VKRKLPPPVAEAVEAAQAKQGLDLALLDLTGMNAFADYFLIASVRNVRQGQALSDEIDIRLARHGLRVEHIEGYHQGEWILMDYGHLVVHIFSAKARAYFDLERLWRSAHRIPVE
jgi:ribosome-associated protein